MENKAEYKKGLNYAIRILTIKDYSIFKMREKLQKKEVKDDHIDMIIEKLLEYNYLRETEYTNSRIKQLIVKGYANNYIIKKLEYEKLEVQLSQIDAIRLDQNLSSEKQLRELIEKKLRHKIISNDQEEKLKMKRKLISFLTSKGYEFEQVNKQLKDYLSKQTLE